MLGGLIDMDLRAPQSVAFDQATATNVVLSGSNLVVTSNGAATNDMGARVADIFAKSSGKYYFEVTLTTLVGGGATSVGIGTTTSTYAQLGLNATTGNNMEPSSLGHIWTSGAFITGLGTRASGDVIGMAIDLDNKRAWFRVSPSGNWNGIVGNDPATTTGGVIVPAGLIVPFVTFNNGTVNVFTGNFGALPFTGAVPGGFTAGWTQ